MRICRSYSVCWEDWHYFLFGMNMMSECLQGKRRGEKMKSILSLLTRNPVMGRSGRRADDSCSAEQQRDHCHGHRFWSAPG